MLSSVDGNQVRVSRALQEHLHRLARANGQPVTPIRTRADLLKAFMRALPEPQARRLLAWLDSVR